MGKLKKICFFLGLLIWMSCGEVLPVQAAEKVESVQLTETDRYDPRYYEPVERILPAQGSLPEGSRTRSAAVSLEDLLVNGLKSFQTKIDISAYQLDAESFFTYYCQVLNNHTELFYVKSGCSYATTSDRKVLYVCPAYLMDEGEAKSISARMNAVANEAAALVSDDMEDYEKALVVHDWLAVYCEYDYENYLAGTIPNESHTGYGALINKAAVCDGYAKAYQYIMQDKLGIPCYLTSSDAINHAWNIICIGGKYYHVDVTWDDPTRDCIGRVKHNNFLLSDAGITATGHRGWESSFTAEDSSCEDALWKNTNGSVINHGGQWYFVNDASFSLQRTGDMLDGTPTELYSIGRWSAGGNSYYTSSFAYLQSYRGALVFNGPKQIYKMPFDSEQVTTLAVPSELPEEVQYNIYGFKIDGDTMYYSIQSTPNIMQQQSAYIASCEVPWQKLTGSVTIDGEARYGNVLTANVTFGQGIVGEPAYQWYRGGQSIAGATAQNYQLTEEDIGEVLMVRVVLGEYSGELTAETSGIVGKAVPRAPEKKLAVLGVYGAKLSTIALPDGYEWAKPDAVMDKLGEQTYEVRYCPDSALYETLENLVASVEVSCVNHIWNAGTVVTEATCTESGTILYTCEVCKEEKTESISATGHARTEARNQKKATCKEPGYTGDTYCLDCGEKIAVGSETPATGAHSWDAGTVTKKSTYTAYGTRTYTCTVCGATKTEKVSKLTAPKKGKTLTVGKMVYKVTKQGPKNGTVEFVKRKSTAKTVTIPAKITVDGISYQVTSIGAKSLKNDKKVTQVVLGSNIKTIGKEAFSGCRNLKKIKIQSTKLKTVGKNAIKNIHKKAVIQCPSKKVSAYRKLFDSKTGYKKTMKIKK